MFNFKINFSIFKQIVSYIRVSTGQQQSNAQRHILDSFYAANQLTETNHIEANGVSSGKGYTERHIDDMLSVAKPGALIVISELSRLARSISETFIIVERIRQRGCTLYEVKNNLVFAPGKPDLQSEMMLAMLSLAAAVEKDHIRFRTKARLAELKAKGIKLGNADPDRARRSGATKKAKTMAHAKTIACYVLPLIDRGLSQRAIRDELNRLGLRTVRGAAWTLCATQKLIKCLAS